MLRQKIIPVNAYKGLSLLPKFKLVECSYFSTCSPALKLNNVKTGTRTNLYTLIKETTENPDYQFSDLELQKPPKPNRSADKIKIKTPTPLSSTSARYADLHLFSTDKSTGNVTPNWEKTADAIQKCIIAGDHEHVIQIANRIEANVSSLNTQANPELLPPMSIINLILRSLSQLKSTNNAANLVAPLIIKILEKVVANRSFVNALTLSTLKSLAMSVTWITQPFFRYSLISLLNECTEQLRLIKPQYAAEFEILMRRSILHTYMNSIDIETCLVFFEECIRKGDDEMFDLADNILSKVLSKTNDVNVVHKYYQLIMNEYANRNEKTLLSSANQQSTLKNEQYPPLTTLKPEQKFAFHKSTILKFFNTAIQAREPEIVANLWRTSVIPQQIEPSDAQLKMIMDIFTERELGQVYGEVFRKLSLRAFQDLDDFELSSIFNNAAETEKLQEAGLKIEKNGDSEFHEFPSAARAFLPILELCFNFSPNIDFKLFDPGFDALWHSYASQNSDPWGFAEAFKTPSLSSSLSQDQPAQSKYLGLVVDKNSNDFRTFKVNCMLRTVLRNWGTRAVFALYQDFLNEGQFVPNVHTFEELAFAALLLRNSKLLGKTFFDECLALGIKPSPNLYELLIRAACRGKDSTAAYYYLSQIAQGNINTCNYSNNETLSRQQLSQNITNNVKPYILLHLKRLKGASNDISPFKQFMSSPENGIIKYASFPTIKSLSNSSASFAELSDTFSASYNYNLDRSYTINFKEGWPKDKINLPKDYST